MSFCQHRKPAAGAEGPCMDAEWLDAHRMPRHRQLPVQGQPRMIVEGSGALPHRPEGRKILTASRACGRGQGRREIAEAIGKQATKLDYAPGSSLATRCRSELANRVKELTPAGLDYVFFTGSGLQSRPTRR